MPASAESPAASVRLPADPHDAVADDPGFARVALLRRVGLVEDAWQELEAVVQNSVGDTPRLYGLSGAYVKAERYHMALRIVRRHFGGLAASGDPALPRAFWEILYPFAWRDDLAEAATRAGLDTFLVAAVVREESSYYPRALSRTGARGLMQLMPGTARPMARASRPALRGGRSARRLAGQSGNRRVLPGRTPARVQRSAHRARGLQRRSQARTRVVEGAAHERRRGVGGADPIRRDAAVRQARDAVVAGVPPPLRWELGIITAASSMAAARRHKRIAPGATRALGNRIGSPP
jgi:hypothetical protein